MSIYALVDCNNFYASCERAFNPKLKNKPIVILSNNDGCVIARSNEAKVLGIPMGAPYFQYEKLMKQHSVVVFSSNYTLYGDMSNRVMTSLRNACPEIEVYSIDEAFLQLDQYKNWDLVKYCSGIRENIKTWVGIPVSIGIAPTKTLAKIANRIAKKQTSGIFSLCDQTILEEVLSKFEIGEIWGIGRQLTKKLKLLGINTAKDLRDANAKIIRQSFGVVVERIITELNGVSCLSLESTKPKKNIMASRSFGQLIITQPDLAEAISHHVARASYKLRKQKSKAQSLQVFILTNRFKETEPQYYNSIICGFEMPTNDTSEMINAAKHGLRKIYKSGYRYKKAGVMLMNIVPETLEQADLFCTTQDTPKRKKIMELLDRVNKKFGEKMLFIAAQGIRKNWRMRSESRSNRYTTCWDEIIEAKT